MARKDPSQYSPAYAKRLARAEAKGLSRQQARGHKAGEHIIRKERAALRRAGQLPPPTNRKLANALTKSQRASVTRFANMQAIRALGAHASKADLTAWRGELMSWANQHGYPAFTEMRALYSEARRQYLAEVASGTWEARDEMHTLLLWAEMMDYPEPKIFFYH